MKSSLDILGIILDTYRKWIEYQFTPEMNWNNIEIDHVKSICMFNVSDDEELKLAFNWKNTQPPLKEVHSTKGIKFNLLDFQLQFIKAYQFLKLNEQRLDLTKNFLMTFIILHLENVIQIIKR